MRSSLFSRFLPGNPFLRNVSLLTGGTLGAQLVTVLAAPVLSRLYSAHDFGMLAVFSAILSLVAVVACLRYELAIPIPAEPKEAAALVVLSVLCVGLVAALCAIPFVLFADPIAHLLKTPAVAPWLFLVPLGVLLVGMYNVMNFWAIRHGSFGPLARTKFTQSVAALAIQAGGASFGPAALLVGQVAGQGMGWASLAAPLLREQRGILRQVGWRDVAGAARTYWRFPLVSSWGAIFNTLGSQLPPLVFAALFGPAAAGLYALANRVLAMPMLLVGQSVAKVFYAGAAEASRKGTLPAQVAAIHGRLAHVALPPTLMLLMAGPQLFAWVFGPGWRGAGEFAQWMAPWLYLVVVTSPLTSIYGVLEKQFAQLVFQAVLLGVRVGSLAAGAALGDVGTAVALFGIGSALCWLGNLIFIFRASGNPWRDFWRPSAHALLWSGILLLPLALSAWDMPGVSRTGWSIFAVCSALCLILTRYVYLMRKAWQ